MKVLLISPDNDILDCLKVDNSTESAHIVAWWEEVNILKARTCQEGLAMVEKNSFDSIIINHSLPDCDAIELIPLIQKVDDLSSIIFVTENGDEMLAVRALQTGAADYVPKKKLTKVILYKTLRNSIKHHQTKKDKSFYEEFYNNAPVGFYRTSTKNGTILKANKKCADILGFESVDYMKKNTKASDLYSSELRNKLINMLNNSGSVTNFEILLDDGTWIALSAKLNSKREYLEGSIVDITYRKIIEKKLQQHREKEMESLKSIQENVAARLLDF
jgi:PAS domain S-box-containing protein